jgi:hypothetical protein
MILDGDGSALKLDRSCGPLPRLLSVEFNGDPIHAAPPAARVGGITVVRRQSCRNPRPADRTSDHLASRRGDNLMDLRDVRGFRVEVWDEAAGNGSACTSASSKPTSMLRQCLQGGQIERIDQGTGVTETPKITDDPLHVHDALFG